MDVGNDTFLQLVSADLKNIFTISSLDQRICCFVRTFISVPCYFFGFEISSLCGPCIICYRLPIILIPTIIVSTFKTVMSESHFNFLHDLRFDDKRARGERLKIHGQENVASLLVDSCKSYHEPF